jgi:hypothetical protein
MYLTFCEGFLQDLPRWWKINACKNPSKYHFIYIFSGKKRVALSIKYSRERPEQPAFGCF